MSALIGIGATVYSAIQAAWLGAGPGPGPGAGVDDHLLEVGDHLLLENNDALLLEG